jgi:replicative DNA helicase
MNMRALSFPHDVEAERAVIGAVLADSQECWPVASDLLRASDFYEPRHVEIWRAVSALGKAGGAIDMLLVRSQLLTAGALDKAGGDEYLVTLTDTILTPESVSRAARKVSELALVREVMRAALRIAGEGSEPIADVGDYLDRAATVLTHVCERRSSGLPVTHISDAMVEAYTALAQRQASGQTLLGYATGFPELDRALSGFARGDLIVLAARPGMGKTALANGLKIGIAESTGKHVLSLELEMTREQLSHRVLSSESGVPLSRIRSAQLDARELALLASVADDVSRLPFSFIVRRGTRISELRAEARRQTRLHGPLGLIVVDYLQIVRAESRSSNRERDVADISEALKALAGELDCPVLALSQLNRNVEARTGAERRPRLSDLRESGAIEQDADTVLLLHREEVYDRHTEDKGIAEVIIAKQRSGRIGTVRLRWVGELTRLESLETQERHEQGEFAYEQNGKGKPNGHRYQDGGDTWE